MSIIILEGVMGSGKSLYMYKQIKNFSPKNIFIFKEFETYKETSRIGVSIDANYLRLQTYSDIFEKTNSIIKNCIGKTIIIWIDSILLNLEIENKIIMDYLTFIEPLLVEKNITLFIPSNPIYFTNDINKLNICLKEKFETIKFNCFCLKLNCSNLGTPKNIKKTNGDAKDTNKNNYLTMCEYHYFEIRQNWRSLIPTYPKKIIFKDWVYHVNLNDSYFKNLNVLKIPKTNLCVSGNFTTPFLSEFLHQKGVEFASINNISKSCSNKKNCVIDFNDIKPHIISKLQIDEKCLHCKRIKKLVLEPQFEEHVHIIFDENLPIENITKFIDVSYEDDNISIINYN